MSDPQSASSFSSESESDSYEPAVAKMLDLLGDDAFDLDSENSQSEEEEEEGPVAGDDVAPLISQNDALEKVVGKFKIDAGFFDTQTLTFPDKLEIPDVGDDLQREVQFYKQALWAANHARALFIAADKPFTRPEDYFAEMVKSDHHMERVRTSLLDQHNSIKASEEAKRLRYLKKYGKKVQVAKLQERQKQKKELTEKVKDFKKKRSAGKNQDDGGEDFDVDVDMGGEAESRSRGSKAKGRMPRNARDKKYGRPQDSKRPKQNTKESVNDLFSRGPRTNKGSSKVSRANSKTKGKAKRLGKSRRH